MELSRRSLITGLISMMAAPAIVRASSLMPVKQMLPEPGVIGIDMASGPDVAVQTVFFQNRLYWITGKDNIIRYSAPMEDCPWTRSTWTFSKT